MRRAAQDAVVATAVTGSGPGTAGLELLKSRDFGLLWCGQVISQIGDSLNKVALLWFVYVLTGSALKMTIIGLLQTVPPLVFGPLIGVYLDRLPKKAVMIWVDLIRTVLVLLIPLCYVLDGLSLSVLYLLVFVISSVSTVFGPALASAVPLLVTRSQFTAANALMQGAANIGLLVGPAVSGLGIALIGAQNVLYVDAATFLISALCLVPVRLRGVRGTARAARDSSSVLQELAAGFRFVFRDHRTIFLLMLTATLFNLGASAFVFLLPVMAREVLRVGPIELGWIWSGLGIGMLIASAALAWVNQGALSDRFRIAACTLGVGGLAVCGLGVLDRPIFAMALVMVVGGSTALFTPIVWTLLQELTPGRMLGRVFTTFSTGGMASGMVGMAGFGWMADAVGPAVSLIGVGLILLATAAVLGRFSRGRQAAPIHLIATCERSSP